MPTPTNDWLIAAAVGTSAILALVLLVRRPASRVLGARTAYALWLAVPIQLLVSMPLLNPVSPVRIALPSFTATLEAGGPLGPGAAAGPAGWLTTIWMLGTALVLARLVIAVIQSHRLLAGSLPWSPSGSRNRIESRHLRTALSGQVKSPVVAGLWRPTVVLPLDIERRLDPESLALVLRHEACHARRRDNLVNLLANTVLAVLWFNPLAWLAYRAFRADQELSCDAHTLNDADDSQRARYGRAMLDLVSLTDPGPMTTAWHLHHSTKRRITMLKQHHHSRLRSLAGTMLVCAFTALSIVIAPATGAAPSATDASNDASPTPLVRINPGYPVEAVERKLEGHVTMEFTVTENGEVADIVVVKSAPGTTFDEAAVEALARWRFVPEVVEGVAVPRRATQTIEFRLD